MSFAGLDAYISGAKQKVPFVKTTSRVAVAVVPFSIFDLAGNPGAGVLAGTSLTAGVVPNDSTAGFPIINPFGGSNGYLSNVQFGSSVACRVKIFDCVWKGGAYPFNANQALSLQPSYVSRMPGGIYNGTEIWIECVTAFTGNQSILVTYTNQAGVTGRTTGTIATGVAPIVGRMLQLPLQAGDSGVQKIESVVSTVATVGTFNVLVLRPLWEGRIGIINGGDGHGLDRVGMPEVFTDSALFVVIVPDSTTGLPELLLEVSNG
jgi:hypothetical protein